MPKDIIKHNVRMLASVPGVDDGEIYPRTFLKDEVYEIGDDLFNTFKNAGVVELTKGKPTAKAEAVDPQKKDSEDDNPLLTELNALDDKELMKRAKKAKLNLKGEVSREDVIAALIKDAAA